MASWIASYVKQEERRVVNAMRYLTKWWTPRWIDSRSINNNKMHTPSPQKKQDRQQPDERGGSVSLFIWRGVYQASKEPPTKMQLHSHHHSGGNGGGSGGQLLALLSSSAGPPTITVVSTHTHTHIDGEKKSHSKIIGRTVHRWRRRQTLLPPPPEVICLQRL